MMFHQWDHYRALENDPMYLARFLVDVGFEELSWHLPRTLEPVEVVATPQEPWLKNQWDIIDQLRCQGIYLNRRLSNLEKQVKEQGTTKRGKYKDYKMG